jgi:TfoX/Sxy family transcriptional regulator of competence genes
MRQLGKARRDKQSSSLSPKTDSASVFAEELAARVRIILRSAGNIREQKMFGGIGFMLDGNLLAGASRRGLLIRTGKDRKPEALAWPHSRPMVMRGRSMEGYVYIDPPGASEEAVRACVRIARAFVETLPRK